LAASGALQLAALLIVGALFVAALFVGALALVMARSPVVGAGPPTGDGVSAGGESR
jgi:hypothetical protein